MAEPQFESFVSINKDEIEQCKQEFAQGGVKAYESFLRRKADEWKSIPLNIGIIGNSGSGKSTFINAIRGLTADDDGAAKVGEVETTTVPTPYSHPNNELLKFWDLPGVGTPDFPRETYLERVGFAEFDFFLIMSKDRFTENDLWIAAAINEKKKKFFFIRSKIHNSIKDDKKSHPKTHNSEILLAKIREDIRTKLTGLYQDNVFLIDNHQRKLYDFDRLEQRLIDDLPLLKKAAFVLSVSTLSEEMVRKKLEILRQQIWKICALSGLTAAIPVPGLSFLIDTGAILAANQFYFKQLGLDEDSLKRTATVMSCDITELMPIVAKVQKEYLTMQGLIGFLQTFSSFVASEAAEAFFLWIPVIGSIVAGAISATTMYTILNRILTNLGDTALKVVRAATASSKVIKDSNDDDDEDE